MKECTKCATIFVSVTMVVIDSELSSPGLRTFKRICKHPVTRSQFGGDHLSLSFITILNGLRKV